VQICTGIVDSLQIGGITLSNVEAVVMPDMNDVALLGQTALRRLNVEQANGQIRLSVIQGVTK
jgi:predicted aspartyl protease